LNHRKILLLLFILATALFFRLVGIRFGEPLVVHPDEHNLIFHAMEAGSRSGNPGWFEYPSAMIYLTLGLEGLHYLTSGSHSPQDFWKSYKETPFPFSLWVRVPVALLGVLGVFAVWLLGREWDSKRTSFRFLSWGGAVLLAVHLLHVRDSHFATVDVALTTAITLALWLLLREFNRDSTNVGRLWLLAVFIGLCCGIKYSAAPLVFPLLYVGFAHAVRAEKVVMTVPWLIGSGSVLLVGVLVGFLITTPYAILDYKTFWDDLGYQWFTSISHEAIYGGGEPFLLGYIQGPWMWGGENVLGVASFFGLMLALLRRYPEDKVLLIFAIPYLLLISFFDRVWGRWFLPLVPLQILWTVRFIAIYADHPWAVSLMEKTTRNVVAVLVILLIGLPSAASSLPPAGSFTPD